MSKGDGKKGKAKKESYFARLTSYFDTYKKILLVCADNVGSQQMHNIRRSLRGDAVIVMGKNTMVRKVMRNLFPQKPEIEKLYPHILGNVGLVFTNQDLKKIRDKLIADKIAAPAKAGVLAPVDVFVQPQNTGMGPEKTSFFQTLGIGTKITKGTIEILAEQHVVKKGERVSPSESALLIMLKISPFTYGLVLTQCFEDGSAFPPSVLDIDDAELLKIVLEGISNVASVSLALHYPSKASVAHSLVNGYKNLLAVALVTEYSFPLADKVKTASAAAPKVVAAPAAAAKAPVAEVKKVEVKEESDEDMAGLFD